MLDLALSIIIGLAHLVLVYLIWRPKKPVRMWVYILYMPTMAALAVSTGNYYWDEFTAPFKGNLSLITAFNLTTASIFWGLSTYIFYLSAKSVYQAFRK